MKLLLTITTFALIFVAAPTIAADNTGVTKGTKSYQKSTATETQESTSASATIDAENVQDIEPAAGAMEENASTNDEPSLSEKIRLPRKN